MRCTKCKNTEQQIGLFAPNSFDLLGLRKKKLLLHTPSQWTHNLT